MQITRKQTSDESESSDSTLILNKHGLRVYPAETITLLLRQLTEEEARGKSFSLAAFKIIA